MPAAFSRCQEVPSSGRTEQYRYLPVVLEVVPTGIERVIIAAETTVK